MYAIRSYYGTDEGLDFSTINSIAGDISGIASEGNEVVIVSSGAVAAGMKKLGLKSRPSEIRLKQAAAAVGQSNLMWAYERSFSGFGKKVAQVLLTREDFADRKRYINARNTMMTLLSYSVIPVINENDTVATDEIRFGDNDNLAALVAISIEADNLFILSDVDGLYEDDPRKNPHAELISYVETVTPDVEWKAGSSGSLIGTGGMYSKVKSVVTSYNVCYTKLLRKELRAERFPANDVKAIRMRNLRLQRLYSAQMVIRNFARERRLPLV